MEIGIDGVDIHRFEGIEKNKRLLKKIFTPKEIKYCLERKPSAQHFAVRFAGKEAVIKGLSRYNISLAPNQIEIINHPDKFPIVNFLKKLPVPMECKISLSHANHIALAQALILKK